MDEQANNKAFEGLEKGVIERASEEANDRFMRGMAGGKQGGVDRANRTVRGVASTIQLDRDGEVILPGAFEARLDIFTGSHSPFCARHLSARWSDSKPAQIGWVMGIKIERQRVPCEFRFAETATAEEWWKLAADPNGKGIAFSIGFIPIRWVRGSVADLIQAFPELKRPFAEAKLTPETQVRVYTEIELLEISAVEVPSNRQAMQLLAMKAAYDQGVDPLAVLGELIEGRLAAKATSPEALEAVKGELVGRLDAVLTEFRDRFTELTNAITLASDTLGQSPPPNDQAPPAGDRAADDDAAKQGAAILTSAARLKAAATNKNERNDQ